MAYSAWVDPATSGAAGLLDELLSPQSKRQHHQQHSLEACLAHAREALRGALTTAGINEHRAMVTSKPADAAALSDALSAVDSAYATMWAYEAAGAKLRVHDVQRRRVELLDEIAQGIAAKQAAIDGNPNANFDVNDLHRLHKDLVAVSAPPESGVRIIALPSLMMVANSQSNQQQQKRPPDENGIMIRRRLRKNGRAAAAPAVIRAKIA